MKVFCWNIRGLGTSQKKAILQDIIKDHTIDIIAIQEIKKKFSKRLLTVINVHYDNWHFKPLVGLQGGNLFGCDSSKFQIESVMEQ
jgi:exonuclease III